MGAALVDSVLDDGDNLRWAGLEAALWNVCDFLGGMINACADRPNADLRGGGQLYGIGACFKVCRPDPPGANTNGERTEGLR